MKWVLIVLGVLVLLVVLLAIVGALQPKEHVATITVRIAAPDSTVWAVVSDFERVPEWNPEVTSVKRIADVDGKPTYREKYGGFEVTNVVRELVERRKIVREILPEGSFSGTWTLELSPAEGGSNLQITERGRVENPIFRAMMLMMDPRKTMRAYVGALAKKLGVEPVE